MFLAVERLENDVDCQELLENGWKWCTKDERFEINTSKKSGRYMVSVRIIQVKKLPVTDLDRNPVLFDLSPDLFED